MLECPEPWACPGDGDGEGDDGANGANEEKEEYNPCAKGDKEFWDLKFVSLQNSLSTLTHNS